MTAPALTPATAYSIASQWGSYISAGDPGACFYSFRYGDGRPVSEEHRSQCLAYLDERLLPHLARDLAEAGQDKAELEALRVFLMAAPIWSEARQ
jgi:hypothetical protein